jgi:hypothetical protein
MGGDLVKVTVRRRDIRTAARALFACCLTAALAAGCGGSAPRAAAPARASSGAPATTTEESAEVEAREQIGAQRAWCSYLQALYLRAAEGATSWPRFQQCTEATTMASPKMLRQTADCSLRALQRFQGDPFTAEYAAQVSQCGVQAVEMSTAPASDLAPYVAAICGRVTSCQDISYAECRQSLEAGLGEHLTRAVGAMNQRGRTQLRACLGAVRCEDIGDQVTACIEPIIDNLLWLPS